MNNTYKKYIDEFMPYDEMRNYLKTQARNKAWRGSNVCRIGKMCRLRFGT